MYIYIWKVTAHENGYLNMVWKTPAITIKSDSVEKSSYLTISDTAWQDIAISNFCNDEVKDKILQILDFLTTEEGVERVYFGEEGKTFKVNNEGKISYIQPINRSICPVFTNRQSNNVPYHFEEYGLDHYFALSYPDWEKVNNEALFKAWVDLNELNRDNVKYYKQASLFFLDKDINKKVQSISLCLIQFMNNFMNAKANYEDYVKMVNELYELGLQDVLDYYNDK